MLGPRRPSGRPQSPGSLLEASRESAGRLQDVAASVGSGSAQQGRPSSSNRSNRSPSIKSQVRRPLQLTSDLRSSPKGAYESSPSTLKAAAEARSPKPNSGYCVDSYRAHPRFVGLPKRRGEDLRIGMSSPVRPAYDGGAEAKPAWFLNPRTAAQPTSPRSHRHSDGPGVCAYAPLPGGAATPGSPSHGGARAAASREARLTWSPPTEAAAALANASPDAALLLSPNAKRSRHSVPASYQPGPRIAGPAAASSSSSNARGAGQVETQMKKAPMRNWRERNHCATKIQVAFQNWQACGPDMSTLHRARGAARSIQRWWQMLQSRHRLQVLLARIWWGFSWELLQMDSASRRLQSGARMMKLGRWRKSAGRSVRLLQAWWRGNTVRRALGTLRCAVVKVQRWHRQHSRWQSLLLFLGALVGEVRRKRAATTKVQRLWRGFRTRKLYGKEMELLRRAAARRKAALRKAHIETHRRGLSQPKGNHRFGGPVAYRNALGGGDDASNLTRPRLGARSPADVSGRFGGPRTSATPEVPGDPPLPPVSARGGSGPTQGRSSPRDFNAPTAQSATAPASAGSTAGSMSSRRLSPVLGGTSSPPMSGGSASSPIGKGNSSPPMSAGSLSFQIGRGNVSPPMSGGSLSSPIGKPVDADKLFTELMGRQHLSCAPRAPLWGQEPAGRSDIEAVRTWLGTALPTIEVRTVLRVECTSGVFSAAYEGVRKTLGPERLLWHGTSWDSVANIVRHGFNRAYGGRHGCKLGRGSYFAEEAAYALRFCGRNSQTKAIFLAGVLPGRCCRGEESLVEPPADSTGSRFDSTVDDPERPKVFCVFRDFQALPLYVAEIVMNPAANAQ